MNWRDRIYFAPSDTGGAGGGDGGGGGGGDAGGGDKGGGAGAAGGDKGGDDKGAAGDKGDKGNDDGGKGKPSSEANPYKVPDKFLTDGKPDYGKLVSSYADAEKALMRKGTEVRADVERAFHEERAKAAPATPGDYQVEDKFILGDREITMIKDDPMLDYVRQVAHNNHWTQQQFTENVRGYVAQQLSSLPKWTEQAKLLGPNADARHARVDGFLRGNLSQENYQTFAKLPATAATIKAVEEIMELAGHPKLTDDTTAIPKETLTREQLREMQNDSRYTGERGKPIEQAFVNRVRAGYRALAKNGGSG
jgi:hypothetical protein